MDYENQNDEYENYESSRPLDRNQINTIDPNIDPLVARNLATYYSAKGEAWSVGMARRLRVAANDNDVVGRKRA